MMPPCDHNEPKKIVLFGGSFDPPHIAHITLPPAVMRTIGADRVVYIPSGLGPFKQRPSQTPAYHRLAMLQLALQGVSDVQVLTDEIQRATDRGPEGVDGPRKPTQPTYTVETLEALRRRWGPQVHMRLLIGGDHLRVFDQWHQSQRIIELAQPLVMVRPPDTPDSLLAQLPRGYDRQEWGPRLIDVPQIDVSSSQIRHLVAHGQPITHLVPPVVESYIQQHGLYRQDS